MGISASSIFAFGRWPVGCPFPKAGFANAEQHAQEWLNKNPDASSLKKANYSTYIGAGLGLGGLIATVFGFFKENQILTYIGAGLAFIGTIAASVGGFFGLGNTVANEIQKAIVVGPATKTAKTPESVGIENYERVTINSTDGVKLKGFHIPAPKGVTKKTVLYIHGVRNNTDNCLDEIKKIQDKLNVNVLVVDPRGFGDSTYDKEITCDGLINDGKAMYDYLVQKKGLDKENIAIFAHSLGTAIAIEVANEKPVKTLILQDPFTRTDEAARTKLKRYHLPDTVAKYLSSMLETNFDSAKHIKSIKAENLIVLHGSDDGVVDTELSKSIYNNATLPNRKFFLLKGAGHSDYFKFYTDEHFDLVRNYFELNPQAETVKPEVITVTPQPPKRPRPPRDIKNTETAAA